MTSRFINGAKYAVSTVLGAAAAITAVSNATPAVITSATMPTAGDILILTSGWTDLNGTVVRALAAGGLEGVDTTDVVAYPAGEGVGAYQKASTFVGLSQVRDVAMDGGDQNYFQFQYVEDKGGRQRQSPTFKSAMTMKIELDYDPALPWYQALITADAKKLPVVLRETLPAGDVIYYVGMLAFNKVPTKGINQNMTVKATFSLQADPQRYGS